MTKNLDLSLYVEKLERRYPLGPDARAAIMAVQVQVQTLEANREFVREGDRPTRSCLVISGFVSRHRTLRSGDRQILSFHVAGDMVDLESALIIVADHAIRTHSPTTIVTVDHADILRLAATYPAVGRAFWFDTLADSTISREWTVNVGRRSASQRTAHLLLEIAFKMRVAGLATAEGFDFPVTQSDFADALGITAVHLNRIFQRFRSDRLIRTHMRTMKIDNEAALCKLAGFDPTYLHCDGPRPASPL